ncbi:MAG: hypothetical protein Q8M20_07485 [Rhodocyclaceae bacterium]|nr:hypothetical protein [Rhodocyclaceae bacterium]MDZ4214254.1 hypothetical protein [Rhodocyclaceae bacterium]
MRLAFLVLLLANLLLFVWVQGYFGMPEAGHEPERLARQIKPDMLRIVSETNPAPDKKIQLACKRIEGLSADEAKSLTDAVHVRGGWETQTLPLPAIPMHWVAIVDLPSNALAEKKKAELRKFGITESQIVAGTTAGTFAVSLGLFRAAQNAQEFLQKLTAKGVRSARVIQHDSTPIKFAVELRAPADQLADTLPGLSAALPSAVTQDCTP